VRPGLPLAVLLAVVLAACGGGDSADTPAERIAAGERLYQGQATCATCHGPDLQGTPMGPPLLHEVYRPSHHPDAAFHAAVRNGVQPHHWDFGPMPPLEHLDEDEVDQIIAYVRAEQQKAGIR
jgi:mono/diheme cytochrome c family protein